MSMFGNLTVPLLIWPSQLFHPNVCQTLMGAFVDGERGLVGCLRWLLVPFLKNSNHWVLYILDFQDRILYCLDSKGPADPFAAFRSCFGAVCRSWKHFASLSQGRLEIMIVAFF